MYGKMSFETEIPQETERYLRDAAAATVKTELNQEISELRFKDNVEEQIHTINTLINRAESRDTKEFLWIAGETLTEF